MHWTFWLQIEYILFSPVFSCMICWVLIFVLSHFYILICMFEEMMDPLVVGLSCESNSYVSWFTLKLRARLILVCLSSSAFSRRCFFCGSFLLFKFHVCLCYNVLTVPCSIVITWERERTSCLSCDVFLCFCHFPIWWPSSGVVLVIFADSWSLPSSLLYNINAHT